MYCFFIILFITTPMYAGWTGYNGHARAVQLCANKNFSKAEKLLGDLLVDSSYDPVLNYDAGVMYHKLNDLSAASACFRRAVASPRYRPKYRVSRIKRSLEFLEHAYFNLANVLVEEGDLKQAISAYENVLDLNCKNEKAEHNLNVVKKMLEEKNRQEQEQQQDQQNEQNDDRQQQGDSSVENQGKNNDASDQNKDSKGENNSDNQGEHKDQEDKKNKKDQGDTSASDKGESRKDDDCDGESREGDDSKSDDCDANSHDNDKHDDTKDGGQHKDDAHDTDSDTSSEHANKERGDNKKPDTNADNRNDTDKFGEDDQAPERDKVPEQTVPVASNADEEQQKAGEQQAMNMQQVSVTESSDDNLDKKTAALLSRVTAYDANNYKKMIREHVKQSMQGNHGQKNW